MMRAALGAKGCTPEEIDIERPSLDAGHPDQHQSHALAVVEIGLQPGVPVVTGWPVWT
jgi:hypothetical protein